MNRTINPIPPSTLPDQPLKYLDPAAQSAFDAKDAVQKKINNLDVRSLSREDK